MEKVEEEEVKDPKDMKYNIKVVKFDAKSKLKVIKEVKALLGVGLKDAKDKVENLPFEVSNEVSFDDMESLKEKLEKQSCELEIEGI